MGKAEHPLNKADFKPRQRTKKKRSKASPALKGSISKSLGKLEVAAIAIGIGLLLIVFGIKFTEVASLGRTGLNLFILPGLLAILYGIARIIK